MAAKITVHTVKCTGTHCNSSSATMNYPNAAFRVSANSASKLLLINSNILNILGDGGARSAQKDPKVVVLLKIFPPPPLLLQSLLREDCVIMRTLFYLLLTFSYDN